MRKLVIPLLLSPLAIARCGFSDDDGSGGKTCMSASDCAADQACNLVTRRCEPKGAIAANTMTLDFECNRLDGGQMTPGGVLLRASFSGEVVDLGIGCLGRATSFDIALTMAGGDAPNARGVSLRIPLDAAAGQTYPVDIEGGNSLAWLEKLDADNRNVPWTYGRSGSVRIDAIDGQVIKGHAEVELVAVNAVGAACVPFTCGSIGSGYGCQTDDPSGTATCRVACSASRPCNGSDVCVDVGGAMFCVPSELATPADPPCTGAMTGECANGQTCVSGALGDPAARFCRPTCVPDQDNTCAGGRVCVGLQVGGMPSGQGACFPYPCAVSSCGAGTACEPISVIETRCTAAGRVSGTFDVRISSDPMNPIAGLVSASGDVPGSGAFADNGRIAALIIMGMEESYVAVGFGSTDPNPNRVLWLYIPVRNVQAGRAIVPKLEMFSEIERGDTTLAEAISGRVVLDDAGRAANARISGSFDLYFAEAMQ